MYYLVISYNKNQTELTEQAACLPNVIVLTEFY